MPAPSHVPDHVVELEPHEDVGGDGDLLFDAAVLTLFFSAAAIVASVVLLLMIL